MKSNKTKNSLLSVFIILITAGVFLLLNNEILDTAMCWYTFSVIMVSEIVLAVVWVTFNGIPQRFAVVLVSLLQTIANIIVSAFFILVLSESYIGFTVYTLISFAVLVVLAFFFYKASAVSEKTSSAKDFFLKCRSAVNSMANSSSGEAWRKELSALEENLRFCNDGVMLEDDVKIYEAICDLNSEIASKSDNVLVAIENINLLIKQHDYIAKNSRR